MQHSKIRIMPDTVAISLERLGEWWSLMILRDALLGPTRFDQCRKVR